MKNKKVFVCQNCGASYPKWMGQCLECRSWNAIEEEVLTASPAKASSAGAGVSFDPVLLRDVPLDKDDRITTNIGELDLVLGGGLVRGSMVLVGGDPGIGKSTLLLQAAAQLDAKVLYISGEESMRQTKMRADRLGIKSEKLFIACESDIEAIIATSEKMKPDVLVVDSIQTVSSPSVSSAPGSVTQVREATGRLMNLAKTRGISVFIVGHVTKSGTIAGPKLLEHMVDTVLYFEGDSSKMYRVLRAVKNRFGSTNEIGVFEMTNTGLRDVKNPSELFLDGSSNSVIFPVMEGTRTVLLEIQCLVSPSSFNNPRRMAMGIDYNKLVLLIAILEKRTGISLYQHDVYLNVVGGFEVDEPAVDLAILMAMANGFHNKELPQSMVVLGEVGLTGEIRAVSHIQQRINEAARMGIAKAVIPKANLARVDRPEGLTVIGLEHIDELVRYFS